MINSPGRKSNINILNGTDWQSGVSNKTALSSLSEVRAHLRISFLYSTYEMQKIDELSQFMAARFYTLASTISDECILYSTRY